MQKISYLAGWIEEDKWNYALGPLPYPTSVEVGCSAIHMKISMLDVVR